MHQKPTLELTITWHYVVAILAMIICTGELHEQAHIQTGRIVCGGYGERNFNVWQTASTCPDSYAFLTTLAGPVFSYLVMWLGVFFLLKARSASVRSFGFAAVFAPLPFARIFTALTGGGDEKVVLRTFVQDDLGDFGVKILSAVIVIAICMLPILIAASRLLCKHRALYIIGLTVAPLIVLGLYMRIFLNAVFEGGYLSDVYVLGTPAAVLAHTVLIAGVLIFFWKALLPSRSRDISV